MFMQVWRNVIFGVELVGPDHRFEGEGRETLEEMGVENSSYI